MTETAVATKTFPVMEVFGPTIQGEGHLAGAPTLFVRFGGCDYRCSWCDSMHAVLPELVRAHARKLTTDEVLDELVALNTGTWPTPWVTLSGGNPAMLKLDELVERLAALGYKVTAETQGSLWRSWLADLDHLTVSPKPPSSEMATAKHEQQTDAFMDAEAHLAEYARTLGAKSFEVAGMKVEIRQSDDLSWDVEVLEQLLDLGLPESRWNELVTQTVSTKVSAAVANQIAKANDAYAEIVAKAQTRTPKPLYVSVSS